MADFRVHARLKNEETVKPAYMTLPPSIGVPSIAPSCFSCFDYTNGLADVVVGYMGAPFDAKRDEMTTAPLMVTVRNERGRRMLDTAVKSGRVEILQRGGAGGRGRRIISRGSRRLDGPPVGRDGRRCRQRRGGGGGRAIVTPRHVAHVAAARSRHSAQSLQAGAANRRLCRDARSRAGRQAATARDEGDGTVRASFQGTYWIHRAREDERRTYVCGHEGMCACVRAIDFLFLRAM